MRRFEREPTEESRLIEANAISRKHNLHSNCSADLQFCKAAKHEVCPKVLRHKSLIKRNVVLSPSFRYTVRTSSKNNVSRSTFDRLINTLVFFYEKGLTNSNTLLHNCDRASQYKLREVLQNCAKTLFLPCPDF